MTIPRRAQIERYCPAEKAISAAMYAVEEMPADVRLTDAVELLGRAKDRVADFVDGINPESTLFNVTPSQPPATEDGPASVWLIERGQAEGVNPTVWFQDRGNALPRWTAIAADAKHFPTKADADAEIDRRSRRLVKPFGRASEHVFLPLQEQNARASTPAPGERTTVHTNGAHDTETYEQPAHGWTCFHCGETFFAWGTAQEHFGATPRREPGCLIDQVAVEGGSSVERGRGLLIALRKAEAERDEAIQRAAKTEMYEEMFESLRDQLQRLFGTSDPWAINDRLDNETFRANHAMTRLDEAGVPFERNAHV